MHPHILPLFAAFEDGNYLAIVLDVAGEGDLYKRLPGIRREEHAVAKYIIAPLLSALAVMHHQGIIHRDLKPENMLLKASHIFISDFGFGINCKTQRPVTRLGTTHFMAPELILHEPETPNSPLRDKVPRAKRHEYGPAIDVWAVGAVTYETLIHRPPFDGPKEADVIKDVLRNKPYYPSSLSPEAREFLKKCLEYDCAKRPSALELYEHPFISRNMPRERWELLHPKNFMTIELAQSSMRENDMMPGTEHWHDGPKVQKQAKRDSLALSGSSASSQPTAPAIRERRKAMHSQMTMSQDPGHGNGLGKVSSGTTSRMNPSNVPPSPSRESTLRAMGVVRDPVERRATVMNFEGAGSSSRQQGSVTSMVSEGSVGSRGHSAASDAVDDEADAGRTPKPGASQGNHMLRLAMANRQAGAHQPHASPSAAPGSPKIAPRVVPRLRQYSEDPHGMQRHIQGMPPSPSPGGASPRVGLGTGSPRSRQGSETVGGGGAVEGSSSVGRQATGASLGTMSLSSISKALNDVGSR